MRKFSVIIGLVFICSFAVVRRRDEEQEDVIYDMVERIVDDYNLFGTLESDECYAGWVKPPDLTDRLIDTKLLDHSINDGIFTVTGNSVNYLEFNNFPGQIKHEDLPGRFYGHYWN